MQSEARLPAAFYFYIFYKYVCFLLCKIHIQIPIKKFKVVAVYDFFFS